MSAAIINLRTPIHQPGRPIRPLSGPTLERYVDLMIQREDLQTRESERRKEALLANVRAETARLALEAIDEQIAAIDRQRGSF